jgi:hypothetical protein
VIVVPLGKRYFLQIVYGNVDVPHLTTTRGQCLSQVYPLLSTSFVIGKSRALLSFSMSCPPQAVIEPSRPSNQERSERFYACGRSASQFRNVPCRYHVMGLKGSAGQVRIIPHKLQFSDFPSESESLQCRNSPRLCPACAVTRDTPVAS